MLAEAGEAARSSARLRRDLSAARQVWLPASRFLLPISLQACRPTLHPGPAWLSVVMLHALHLK